MTVRPPLPPRPPAAPRRQAAPAKQEKDLLSRDLVNKVAEKLVAGAAVKKAKPANTPPTTKSEASTKGAPTPKGVGAPPPRPSASPSMPPRPPVRPQAPKGAPEQKEASSQSKGVGRNQALRDPSEPFESETERMFYAVFNQPDESGFVDDLPFVLANKPMMGTPKG